MKQKSIYQDSDETFVEYQRRRRAEAREACLLERCLKRVCCVCGAVKLRSRAWVVVNRPTNFDSEFENDDQSNVQNDQSNVQNVQSNVTKFKKYSSFVGTKDGKIIKKDVDYYKERINSSKSAIKVRSILEDLLVELPSECVTERYQAQRALDTGILCRGCYIKLRNLING